MEESKKYPIPSQETLNDWMNEAADRACDQLKYFNVSNPNGITRATLFAAQFLGRLLFFTKALHLDNGVRKIFNKALDDVMAELEENLNDELSKI